MFKSDEIALLKLGCDLPKLSSSQIALPKIILPTAESRRFTFAKRSTGSTFNYGDFTNNNAFFWSSLDLSPLAGTDLGETPFYIELVDNAGKKATGYLAAVGAGETLGSELVTNGDFAVAEPPGTAWARGGDWTIAAGVATQTASTTSISQNNVGISGALLFASLNVIARTGNIGMWLNGVAPVYILPLAATLGVRTGYAVWPGTNLNMGIYSNASCTVDDASLKRVTDPPSTAVHIVSSLNGTTRAWQIKETGFDPNTITSWVIYAI